jgi:NADH dehydrogenase
MVHRVLILGGGFGGLYAAKALRRAKVEVTLVDRRNFHLFQPLLYQVATGSLSPGEIASPLRSVLRNQKNAKVLLGDAIDLDPANRELILSDGVVPYDTLVVATGAQNAFFGHNDWQKIAPGLKSIEDATTIRRNVLYAFEEAEKEPDPNIRRTWLTFVIVGAGPTGVELAGALSEIANDTLKHDFRSIRPEDSRIILLDGSPHVLSTYPVSLSIDAEKSLMKLGVRLRMGVRVTSIDANGVTLDTPSGPDRIEAKTVLWAAGVAPSDFGKILQNRALALLDKQGHVLVDARLNIPGHPEIFVIGDLAALEKPLPGVAPVAIQQGKYVARTILQKLQNEPTKPFHYLNKGSLAVIGRRAGVADFGFLRLHGVIAWMMWGSIHLAYLAQFSNRLIVFIRWGIQYITFNRGSRLITDPEMKDTKHL